MFGADEAHLDVRRHDPDPQIMDEDEPAHRILLPEIGGVENGSHSAVVGNHHAWNYLPADPVDGPDLPFLRAGVPIFLNGTLLKTYAVDPGPRGPARRPAEGQIVDLASLKFQSMHKV